MDEINSTTRECPKCLSTRVHAEPFQTTFESALQLLGGEVCRCHACNRRQAWYGSSKVVFGQSGLDDQGWMRALPASDTAAASPSCPKCGFVEKQISQQPPVGLQAQVEQPGAIAEIKNPSGPVPVHLLEPVLEAVPALESEVAGIDAQNPILALSSDTRIGSELAAQVEAPSDNQPVVVEMSLAKRPQAGDVAARIRMILGQPKTQTAIQPQTENQAINDLKRLPLSNGKIICRVPSSGNGKFRAVELSPWQPQSE